MILFLFSIFNMKKSFSIVSPPTFHLAPRSLVQLLLQAFIIIRQRQTFRDDFLFFIFPPIFKKVVKWGSGSFEFYLLVRVISSWMPFILSKKMHAVASWLNQSRDHRKSKARPRNKHQIIRQIRVDDRSETYMSHRGNHEASVTSYVYKIWPEIRGPFDGC